MITYYVNPFYYASVLLLICWKDVMDASGQMNIMILYHSIVSSFPRVEIKLLPISIYWEMDPDLVLSLYLSGYS